jgi:hypothetical protein
MTSLHVGFCIQTKTVCERRRHMTSTVHPRLPLQRARKRHPFCSLSIGKVHVELYPTDDTQSSNAVWINAYLGVIKSRCCCCRASRASGASGRNPFHLLPLSILRLVHLDCTYAFWVFLGVQGDNPFFTCPPGISI